MLRAADLSFPFAAQIPQTPDAFYLRPHYRTQRPIDDLLLKVRPGLDRFITEKYAAEIDAILRVWSAALLRSPQDPSAILKCFAADFRGGSLQPAKAERLRSTPPVEAHLNTFKPDPSSSKDAFAASLKTYLTNFSTLHTADFLITGIEEDQSTRSIKTRIRYEIVGSGKNVHRDQRVGYWELEWQPFPSTSGYLLSRWQAIEEEQCISASPVFVDVTSQAFDKNSSYAAQLGHGADYWRTVLDGACGIDIYGHNGVSAGDIDNDGWDDLYICQPAGLPNRLYRNRGDGTFEDITDLAGVGVLENTACALFADINNSSRQDLIVVRTNGPLLFINEGQGKFRAVPDAFQFARPPQGTFTGAAMADYDRDGWLDIYFCLYLYYQGTDQYKYPLPYFDAQNGPPNFLLRNNRNGGFQDVTAQCGMDKNNNRYSFCCGWNDFNNDGWPDLYVVNDFGRKNLYRNNGDGTFTDVAHELGVEDVGAGMSVSWFDSNHDRREDLYVANMWTAAGERITKQKIFQETAPEQARALYHKHAMGNSLLINGGGDRSLVFHDATAAARVGNGRWSWSSDAWDFDHDGFNDLYVTNGMVSGPSRDDLNSFFWRHVVANSPSEAHPAEAYERGWNAINELLRADGTWSGYERNVFFANRGDGRFVDVSGAIGMDFLDDSRAFALADFDHDGRQEVFLKNRNAPQLRLLKNVVPDLPPSIAFRLRGVKSNRDAIGAVITIQTDTGTQTRTVQAGSGFLSQHSKELIFGLGAERGPVRASIRWPSGLVQQFENLIAGHRILIEEGHDVPASEPFNHPLAARPATTSLSDALPLDVETWLLAPVAAPDFALTDLSGNTKTLNSTRGKPILLNFWASDSSRCDQILEVFAYRHVQWSAQGLQLLTVNTDARLDVQALAAMSRARRFSFPILRGTDDVGGIYNILFQYLFDRHRDLPLPTSFLIDADGNMVKLYQGSLNPQHLEEDFRAIPHSASDRIKKALPFSGVFESIDFRRNYLSYGSVFFQREYFDQAASAFEQALRDNPTSAEALYGIGSVYLKQQKNTEAYDAFRRATTLAASYPDTIPNAWNNLGLLAAREGRTGEAIADFQNALRISPDNLIALNNLANAYRQAHQWDQAQEVFERALTIDPDDPDANYGLGMVFAQKDDTARTYEHLQKALKSRPVFPEALNNLGILYLRTRRRDEAVATFEQCMRVAPSFDQAYLNLARVYVLEGNIEKAKSVLSALLKQQPGNARAREQLHQLAQ